MSIRARIIIAALAVVAIVNVVYIGYFMGTERAAALARLRATIVETNRLLAVVASGPLYDGNLEQLSANLESVFANPDILVIDLRESRGDIAVNRARPAPSPRGEPIEEHVAVSRGIDELGQIRVVYTTANIEERLAESRNAVVLFSGALMAVLSIAIYLVARGLTGPIERLTRAAQAIAQGELDREIDARGAQELAVLGSSFVRMRDAIREQLAALRLSEERFAKLFREAPEYMTLVRAADGKFVDVNLAFERDTGHARAEALGRSSLELGLWHDTAQREAVLHALRERGEIHEVEFVLRRRDGTLRHTLLDGVTVTIGGEACWLFIIRDINERKAAEIALQRSEQRFRALVELSSDWYWETDAQHRFTFRQGAVLEKMGLPAARDIGKARWELEFPNMSEADWDAHRAALARGEEFRDMLLERPSPDGRTHWATISGRPLLDEQGRMIGYHGIGRDVTAQVRAEQALRRLNADLERSVQARTAELAAANKELEAFAYSVSHDLRAPLRGIDGFSQMLLAEHAARLDPEAQRLLGRVRAAAQRMDGLIADLLRLSQVSRSLLQIAEVDLSALAGEIAEELKPEAREREVEWRIEPGIKVHGDAKLLRIALTNLLENALKYTRRVSPALIEVGVAAPAGGRNEIFVRDNGAGFDMAYAGRLFQPFQRLHSAAEFEGSGIGLATVQRVVAKHGGEVRAEGRPGAGAVFYVTLPGS